MPEFKNRETRVQAASVWHGIAFAVLIAGLFMFLTNGIPLVQWGLTDFEISKKVCTRWMRYGVLTMFLPFLVWAWKRPAAFQHLWLIQKVKVLSPKAVAALLRFLLVSYAASLSAVGLMRHWALETRAFDLGIFVQAVWNTAQGDFLYSSIKGGICYLGDHMSPLLALLAPLCRLVPAAESLIVIQVLMAASCLFPIAFLAYEKTQHRLIALLFAVMYVFYLPTRSALHEDFHPEVLVDVFLLLAFIFMERKKTVLFCLSLLVAVSAKENMFGIAFMMGFYLVAWKGQKKTGLALMGSAVALFLFVTRLAIPYFSGRPYLYDGNYQHLTQGFPVSLIQHLLQPDVLEYAWKVFLPFLFLPFFHLPTFVLTLPVLIQNLLSNNEAMRSFAYHYTTGLAPFLFVSAIYGFSELCRRYAWIEKRKVFLSFCLLFVALLRSGPSEYFYYTDSASHRTAHRDMIRAQLREIPQQASVLTHNSLIPQMAQRKEIHQFDYHGVPTKAALALEKRADYVILEQDFWEPGTEPLELCLQTLRQAGYQITYENAGFYILQRIAA